MGKGLLKEKDRGGPKGGKKGGLPGPEGGDPADGQREQQKGKSEGRPPPPLAEPLYEPLVQAVALFAVRHDAIRSACGAACFILVLSHFSCVAVCPSQEPTTSRRSSSRTPRAAWPIMVHEMSQALAMR